MTLLPMKRQAMQILKAQKDEENRIQAVNQFVQSVYFAAVHTATTTTSRSYQHPLQSHQGLIINTNIGDIISGLQALFPDCRVVHKHLTKAQDGKLYDISILDPSVLPFIAKQQSQEFIVIDWS